ncbi:MBL fold metallo-hydrolase [Morganella psychrotolerans]|uniref:MBL fold metallo-hydrolase n=1 Tax=Morganella psychrotolerans TaxID=368603 RepID=A0A5M9R9G2_9GAMM|nr:MBL fold metallo-hydrolase [Morganella psychrotolerans]KAA8717380.1 MBL fold metallo-hydrolase [Morganella psychrotolerans]OBU08343.1 MBL fold metallo-hydrolase [Morganella psychrotolerans]
MLRITALLENSNTDARLEAHAGLCLLLDDGETSLLFDTSADDTYIRNAQALGISLAEIDAVVLSHGHYDHFGGLTRTARHHLPSPLTVIAHPHIFEPRRAALWLGGYPLKFKRLSPPFCEETLRAQYQFVLTEKPHAISSRFLFAGEITQRAVIRRYGVLLNSGEADYVRDDSFLIWRGDDGIVIITGCSHAGIESVVGYARKLTNNAPVQAVVGGLHLRRATPAALRRAQQAIDPKTQVFGCHCTGGRGRKALKANDFNTGQQLTFL